MKTYAEVRFFKWTEAETSVSLRAKSGSYGGGSEVLVIQDITGTLSPGGHPGSYNGQDAYNGMLIADDIRNAEDRGIQGESGSFEFEGAGLERCDRFGSGGGYNDERS